MINRTIITINIGLVLVIALALTFAVADLFDAGNWDVFWLFVAAVSACVMVVLTLIPFGPEERRP